MRKSDGTKFKNMLLALAELYGRPVSDPVAGLWWDALKGYDIDAVETAFSRHLQSPDTGQFMPKPADIIRMLAGTSIDAAMVAWTKVDRAVREIGPYASVTFDDPIVMRVLQEMGGWIQLGDKRDDEWPFVGNEFRTRYQNYRSRGETPECPSRLLGLAEENGSKVVLIGNADRARQIRDGTTKRLQ